MENLETVCGTNIEYNVTRLQWLDALIASYEERVDIPSTEDPDAEYAMLRECRQLLAGLREMTKGGLSE